MTPTRPCTMTLAVSCKKCARKMRNFTKHLPGWSVLCHVLLLAVIGLTALSAVSCRTQKSVERATIRADTLSQVLTEYEIQETVTEAVAGDSVSLAIPMEVMQILPEGAEFSKKKGRTRVSLKRQGEAVVAEAETDSIPRAVTRHERKARDSLNQHFNNVAAQETVKEKPPDCEWTGYIVGVAIILCMVLCITAIIKLSK